ncbi:MAG: DNA recombination protein RmuC [Bacteroidales bacterium]|nr:DNA recombination protein RmuC [Bacteroidales bacterium]
MGTVFFLFVAAAVLAVISWVVLAVVALRGASVRRKLVRDHEAAQEDLRARLLTLSTEKAALESALSARDAYEQRLREEQERLAEAERVRHEKDLEGMKDAFKALSAENSRAFKEQSAASIAEMLRPVREKFEAFDRSVSESRRESAAQSAALKENIENVLRHSRSVGDEARNLANALTGYSKVQGDFGEMLLTDVLRNAGLVEGVHFVTQGAIRDEAGVEVRSEEGRRMIPDVLVFYPDDTMVVVDAKVSLKAYREYVLCENVEDRRRWAKAHVESVRAHVDELKAKDYASYVPEGRRKVAYNLMFVPMEAAFRLMLETDPLLWQVAKDNNVLIVSQMTLVIVLNMIQMAWKQADQEKNIAQVYRTAEELMGQLSGWLSSHAALGDALKKAVEAYGESTRKLKDSNQSVIRKIEKLERLGLSPKRSRGKVRTSSRGDASSASVIPPPLRPEDGAPEPEGEDA